MKEDRGQRKSARFFMVGAAGLHEVAVGFEQPPLCALGAGVGSRSDRPSLRDLGAVTGPANNRAAIHLVRRVQSDFACVRSRQDLRFGSKLVRRESRIELDEDLSPQRIESFSLDGVDHWLEGLAPIRFVGVGAR